MAIHLRSAEELEKMHRAGLIVHEVLAALRAAVKPGVTTMDLEKLADQKLAGKPGKPAFKGYKGYPCSLCTSVNGEIVHGIPSPKRKLREGDIVSIDFGMEVDGYYADSAVTVPVGEILIKCARETGLAMLDTRCKVGWSRTVIRWSGNLSGTASAPRCTMNRICRITVTLDTARVCKRAWS
jgi:methionine aminopeptidase type I